MTKLSILLLVCIIGALCLSTVKCTDEPTSQDAEKLDNVMNAAGVNDDAVEPMEGEDDDLSDMDDDDLEDSSADDEEAATLSNAMVAKSYVEEKFGDKTEVTNAEALTILNHDNYDLWMDNMPDDIIQKIDQFMPDEDVG